jgi:thiol-disulfide isomerase/thioredoxin
MLGGLAAGCQPSASPAGKTESASSRAHAIATPASTASVAVDIRSWKQVQELIASQRGKVVVVDIWSTYCAPCMREFPQLVALSRKKADDVACISVAVDYYGDPNQPPEASRDRVLAFLQQKQASFTNVICSDPDEQVFKQLRAAAVPIVLVYDRQGVLRKTFTNDDGAYGENGFSYAQHITPLVEELANTLPPP